MKGGSLMKAVIFDLDGVLCSTDRFHYQAWKSIADEQGIYFDEQINNRLRGVSRMASLDIVLERCDREVPQEEKLELAERKNGRREGKEQAFRQRERGNGIFSATTIHSLP